MLRDAVMTRDTKAVAPTPSPRVVLDAEELRILRLLSEGLPLEAVARRMYLSDRTIRRRIRAICERLKVSTPIEAVVWAVRHRLV